ncbi:unnamed protein product [Heligmosomoides polygyrus]|uniref:Uncharacterized protein n=1 Tax=Heligmosomoides polygyrus TaxID=6339 RepID=A0A183FE69_HELPZ|nr:unnamed protein product [Heligmosomoides polygyrus]
MHYIMYFSRTHAETEDTWIYFKVAMLCEIPFQILSYGFIVPFVMYCHNELWQSELKRLCSKFRCKNRSISTQRRIVRSTFGKEMVLSDAELSQRYFEMLRKDWRTLYYFLVFYINMVTPQYHLNMRILYGLYSADYVFFASGRMAHMFYVFLGRAHYETENGFLIASYLRCFCSFVAFYYLPVAMVERCCATYYLKDYERKNRLHISFTLLLIGLDMSSIPQITLCIALNALAFTANMINEQINCKFYKDSTSGAKQYTLAERYQVSENIKTCRSFNRVVLSIMGFNFICNVVLVVDNFNIPIGYKNLSTLFFNYSAIMYGLTIPFVMYCHNELWQSELKRLCKKLLLSAVHTSVRCARIGLVALVAAVAKYEQALTATMVFTGALPRPTLMNRGKVAISRGRDHLQFHYCDFQFRYKDRTVPPKPLNSIFGKEMVLSSAELSQRYFEMLQKDWT